MGRFEEASARFAAAVEKADGSGEGAARYWTRLAYARHLETFSFVEDADREPDLWREATDLAQNAFGLTHATVVEPAYRYAEYLVSLGRLREADVYYEKAIRGLLAGAPVPTLTQPKTRWEENRRALGLAADLETLRAAAPAASGPTDTPGTCLRPTLKDEDGVGACVHVTPADMPLRIAIAKPPVPAKDGSRTAARNVAVEALREWERAIQPRVPWFSLEFVEKDPSAAVQVRWKRRIVGPWAGFGRLTYRIVDGALHVGGRMEITMQPSLPASPTPLRIEELKLLVSHEFGHVLGLGHSLDENSAMNYSWHTRDRVFVTQVDVNDFLTVLGQPNGVRVDGKHLLVLPPR